MSELAINALNIYYHHFGLENNKMRKKHYAMRLLSEAIDKMPKDKLDCSHFPLHTFKELRAVFLPRQLKKLCDAFLPLEYRHDVYFSDYEWNRYYRNHIYPAEIHDHDSVFRGANIHTIDAILIDRDSSAPQHERVRGKYTRSKVLNF